MSDSSNAESCGATPENSNEPQLNEESPQTTGLSFLTDKPKEEPTTEFNVNREKDQENAKEAPRVKVNDSAEYMIRSDGSVVCKLCGEVLQSRTHWYRHKYKLHVPPPLNPAPLFQCEQCLVFFKSRKGYIGHVSNRHNDDTGSVFTNAQAEAMAKEQHQDFKEETDAEPKPMLSFHPPTKQTPSKPSEHKKVHRSTRAHAESAQSCPENDEKRIREEKLVNDIIDRVRRECEAQGSGAPTRKGYSRRTTVMHT